MLLSITASKIGFDSPMITSKSEQPAGISAGIGFTAGPIVHPFGIDELPFGVDGHPWRLNIVFECTILLKLRSRMVAVMRCILSVYNFRVMKMVGHHKHATIDILPYLSYLKIASSTHLGPTDLLLLNENLYAQARLFILKFHCFKKIAFSGFALLPATFKKSFESVQGV